MGGATQVAVFFGSAFVLLVGLPACGLVLGLGDLTDRPDGAATMDATSGEASRAEAGDANGSTDAGSDTGSEQDSSVTCGLPNPKATVACPGAGHSCAHRDGCCITGATMHCSARCDECQAFFACQSPSDCPAKEICCATGMMTGDGFDFDGGGTFCMDLSGAPCPSGPPVCKSGEDCPSQAKNCMMGTPDGVTIGLCQMTSP
jgi:hypothetical protein